MDFGLVFVVLFMLTLIWVWKSTYAIRPGECGVVLRLGKVLDDVKQPGLALVLWPMDELLRVSLLEQSVNIPACEYLVEGNHTLRLALKLSFRVVDARKALASVHDYRYAITALTENTMRVVVRELAGEKYLPGEGSLGDMLQRRMEDDAREWGLQVLTVEISAG
jgi:regulator of protease activity HflC (stomatin/prohibitin superfamily)